MPGQLSSHRNGDNGRDIECLENDLDDDASRRVDAPLDSAYDAMPWVNNPSRDVRVYAVSRHPVPVGR